MKNLLLKALTSGLFTGYTPVIPGTGGTLLALLLYYILNLVFLNHLPFQIWCGSTIIFFTLLSLLTGQWAEEHFQKKDPGQFVLDEMAGFGCAIFLIPFTWTWWLAAFLLFRFFDIVKPFPAKQVQQYHGGLGIVLDDILAGIYANLVIHLLLQLSGK
ncbi:MAG: phosphatidylglycerophosphatase A [Planctomycetota bacterium]